MRLKGRNKQCEFFVVCNCDSASNAEQRPNQQFGRYGPYTGARFSATALCTFTAWK
jgi:hypothetical protein